MAFDQRQLRTFLAIVDAGSLGRAAARINLTQSALSRVVRETEERLGVPLFDRHTKGMALTSFGEALLPHARDLLFEMEQAVEAIDALRGLKRGVARIGAVAAIARSILPRAVTALLADGPGLQVQLLEAADDRLIAALLRREIDIVLAGKLPAIDGIYCAAECVFFDVYTVYCASAHPLAARDRVTLDDVMACDWVLPARGATPRELFETLLRDLDRASPRIAVETLSPTAASSLVMQTAFIGWLPQPLIETEVAAGKLRHVDIPELALLRQFFIYRRAGGILPAAAQRLVEIMPVRQRAGTARQPLG